METAMTEWKQLFGSIQGELESISKIRLKESLSSTGIALGWLR